MPLVQRLKSLARATLEQEGLGGFARPRNVDLSAYSPNATRGLVLEFVGPSGVGKSTLFRNLSGHLKKNWFLSQSSGQLPVADVKADDVEALHREIFFQHMQRMGTAGHNVFEAAQRIQHQAKILVSNLLMVSGNLPRGFALEEGIFQCFAPTIAERSDEDLRRLLTGRVLVLLYPRDPMTVARQSMKRAQERRRRGIIHLDMDVEARLEKIEFYSRLHHANSLRAERLGAPVLRLATEDPFEFKRSEFVTFEESLPERCAGDRAKWS